ncbi:DUF2759 domain-containing protein [Sutcliffiella cohnii]|uniref:DUF2759 domain-containing protein n=1 Tax=Sutcliffiella cohnii TaxID=33932 RepID=A0A223KT65_9BACI|nr:MULTISPECIES: DUF2759 domain-containing protein [Sutcliffiella]AST92538.1 DUF2759 domain-containing protein [Sutcliffiella cohnii]MED4019058.1 DUF2759 domain-containing protein [Sutcliffiella cohnii]WBL13783.1 DUF2759 domain-containing protein [Sutcliffiella sp. NC1]
MLLVVFFALVTVLSVFSTIHTFREMNLLGIGFSLATLGVFGWFTVMTILKSGYPVAH